MLSKVETASGPSSGNGRPELMRQARKEKHMKITDKKALRILKRAASYELDEQIENYPDKERDGRTDLEFIADEISYQVSCYNEDGHVWKDDLEEAREKLRETKNGKIQILDSRTLKPKYGYWPSDIENAKSIVNEYKRLRSLLKELQNDGFYGRWYTV